MHESPVSVTQLLQNLNEGDSLAAHEIWNRFIDRLIQLADKRLKQLPRRAFDEEDVAVSAFNAFLAGVEDERFRALNDRNDLWQVLAMLTERKAIGVMRREMAEKRGGAMNRGESVFEQILVESSGGAGIQGVADPSPEVLDCFTAGVREMLESLTAETERDIAMLKLQGYSNKEIADQLGIALRAVERKLKLIRDHWQHISDQESES